MDPPMNVTGQRQALIRTCNDTFDKFLGGGLLPNSLNIFERQGPSSRLLDSVWNKSLAAASFNLIVVNFNGQQTLNKEEYVKSLPRPRNVRSELMYKDVRGNSGTAEIKIAWRYSSRSASPPDSQMRMHQIDFGSSIDEYRNNIVEILNVSDDREFNLSNFMGRLEMIVRDIWKSSKIGINVIFKDLIHPFSPIIDNEQLFLKLVYVMRCYSRNLSGAVLISYDTGLIENHEHMKQLIYNSADCVVSFFSFETGQNKLTGYKHIDGIVSYLKVPKINSFGFLFQRELSDWGYRFTKNHRFFVIDELNLPPCHDDEDEGKVGPLEDFRECAQGILTQDL